MNRGRESDPDLPVIKSLSDLADLVERHAAGAGLYVRWSKGPRLDLDSAGGGQGSRDGLTGVTLPGLSANPLAVEPWWGGRSTRLWVARRLYDYRHLRQLRGPGVRPWVLIGDAVGRGPDNEPLVTCSEPVAWIADEVLAECEETIDELAPDEWGPLDRRG